MLPRQLPWAVSGFTGRHAEVAALSGLLDTDTDPQAAVVISVIVGTAGVGKTALAVHWAHQVSSRFPDGQLYVNLRGYDPADPVSAAEALAGFLHSLGVPGAEVPDGTDERSRLYRSRLAGRRMLILLDNARDGDQVRPLLPGNPGCAAVITSRDQLAGLVATDGARRLDLNVLPPADAVELLRSLTGTRADDPETVAELASLCARLPLALRIAAERAAASPHTPLQDLVAELAGARLDSLDAGEERADLRAVFSWSCRQLPDAVTELFALTGLHPGEEVDVYVAAALGGTTTGQARRALSRLQRASLIQATGPGRYAMHDLLRDYANEQAAGRDRREPLTRLFDYYLAASAAAMDVLYPADARLRPRVAGNGMALPAVADRDSARAWLEAERANLVAVVVHAASHGWTRHATDLTATFSRYLMFGGYLPEAAAISHHALQAARQAGDLAAEASKLKDLGSIAYVRGRFGDAAARYREALEQYRRCGDRTGQAQILCNLGITESQARSYQSAADYYLRAAAAFEDTGDTVGGAVSLSYLAATEILQGSLDEAAGHLRQALKVFRDHDDQLRQAEALTGLGDISLKHGELTQAAGSYQESLDLYRHINHQRGVAGGLKDLGEVSLRQGECGQAIEYAREALAIFRQAGYQDDEMRTLSLLARALHQAGQPAAARAELEIAVQLAAETSNTYHQANTHCDLAESHHRDGQHRQARYHWQRALTLYTEADAPEADEIRTRLAAHQAGQDDASADPPGRAAR
jgi:tetratricopeptide (TPR) repeat protein